MKRTVIFTLALIFVTMSFFGCKNESGSISFCGKSWYLGFGSAEIELPDTDSEMYIAGYHNGYGISGVLDLQRANAVWLDVGGDGILLIGIDCIGLSGQTVREIREMLSDFSEDAGCVSINVFSTHDHAGVDTLGLWGEIALDGKNDEFMLNLKNAAVKAAKTAYEKRSAGKMYFGSVETENMQRDSRDPEIYDKNLYQFRFVPESADKNGIRMMIYSAHAESLRGDNTSVSRDYPGVICDTIKSENGDDVLFFPGAVGGLIMTSVQTDGGFDAESNMILTGKRLAEYAVSIDGNDTELTPYMCLTQKEFDVPLDNTLFMYYRFLGIIGNEISEGKSETGYIIKTSLSVLSLGEKTLAMLPGEIFPELVIGDGLKDGDPEPLDLIAEDFGIDGLIVTGLFNDEIGYIVTPSDYVVDKSLPYIVEGIGADGKKHYEETNSVGRAAAASIAKAFRAALEIHTEVNNLP